MPLGTSSLVLAALALQNSGHVLLVSYTRQRGDVPLYFVSIIIAVGEAAKLAINGALLCLLEPDLPASLKALRGLSRRQLLAYAVPAFLYTIGSNVRQPQHRAVRHQSARCLALHVRVVVWRSSHIVLRPFQTSLSTCRFASRMPVLLRAARCAQPLLPLRPLR